MSDVQDWTGRVAVVTGGGSGIGAALCRRFAEAGMSVVVADVDTCYRALGVVHTIWPTVPGRFKDYISTPKQNDYRSLHTTVVGPHRQRVELQIRTHDMHRVAEYGIAAHALYKDESTISGGPGPLPRLSEESRAYAWLRRTVEWYLTNEAWWRPLRDDVYDGRRLGLHAKQTRIF